MTEAEVFEYLNGEAKQRAIKSISITVGGFSGDYVAVHDDLGNCRISDTITEAASRLPGPKEQSQEMAAKADKLEAEASELRIKAAQLHPLELKSFGPDD